MKFKQNLLILSAILVAVLILGTGCFPTTPPVDTDAPKLSTAVYIDANSSSSVNKGDTITFTFDEEMLTSTITSTNVATSLLLSAGRYGTGATISWDTTLKICTVTLGTSPIIVSGTTVNPASSVTDTAGNADNSTAVTISGLTAITVLSSVSISPATATGTVGTAMSQSFTASALSTAATTMTSSCTFTWSISPTTGRGTLSFTSGTTVTYTLPATGVTAGNAVITVSTVKTGTTTPTKTATATITVGTITPPTPTVDPAKLFVSRQNQNAKYTSLPVGATVKVYSNATNDAGTATLKVTIDSSNSWTGASSEILVTDYIFFTVTDSDGWTSPITADGQIPTAPDAGAGKALDSIQATSKNTVTSSVAGYVTGNDKITLYVGGTAYSAATSVGSTMTVTTDLVAGDEPRYTRTNPDGHESGISAADGQILQLVTATDTDNAANPGVIDPGDTLTLNFVANVDVNVPITVFNISWVASAPTAALDDGTGSLALTGTYVPGALVLTATANCTDFAALETVDFNILTNTPIVDTVGGNQVLPAAAVTQFTAATPSF